MAVYVWRDGHWRDKKTGELMPLPEREGPCAPMAIIGDIAPYQSPVSGEVVTGRAGKRDDLKRHGCVDAADLPSPTGGKVRKVETIRKYNLPETMLKGSE